MTTIIITIGTVESSLITLKACLFRLPRGIRLVQTMGVPGKITDIDKKKFVENVRRLGMPGVCAELLGLTRQAFEYWAKVDPVFQKEWYAARAEYEEGLLNRVESPEWLLKHLKPTEYVDRTKVEVSGDFSMNVGNQWLGKKDDDGE